MTLIGAPRCRSFLFWLGVGLFAVRGSLVLADPVAPKAGRLEVEAGNRTGFVSGDSLVQVRENDLAGTPLSLRRNLGVKPVQVPYADLAYWFSARDAVELQLRYVAMNGTRALDHPVDFNGATIADGQTVHVNPLWYSVGFFYERRWTPSWAGPDGDVRGVAGLEYTFVDFRINGGHAPVISSSPGTETKEGFYVQELPMPTVGLQWDRRLSRFLVFDSSLAANWLDHVNSGRKEGGTIYLSQRKLEAHLQIRLSDNRRFRTFHPMAGVFYFDFRQREDSHEDGNLVRLSMFGPELGLQAEFE